MNKVKTYLIIILISLLIIMLSEVIFLVYIIKTNKNSNISMKDNISKDVEEGQYNNVNIAKNEHHAKYENEKNNDIFADYYEQADALLQNMTLEEKVGQMFLVKFLGYKVMNQIENYYPCGYIFYANDFSNETKDSILEKMQQYQNASKIKLVLAVDEEGGTVVRVSCNKEIRSNKFLSPQQIWQEGKLPAILADSTEKSNLLRSIGLNMNLAPVADITTNPESFMYDRAYGKEAAETCTYVSEIIKTMNNDGMISVMKHFPGYGNNVDTHTGIAIDERPYDVFENSDFLPFKSGIAAGGPCILVSHNIVISMDRDKPASISKKVHDILRTELNFSGIIITDDLDMDAVDEYVNNGEAAIQAVLAGNDIIITSNFEKQSQEIIDAINQGIISEELINEAVRRILAWKYMYKIM